MSFLDVSRRRIVLAGLAALALVVVVLAAILGPLGRVLLVAVVGLAAFVTVPALALRRWWRVLGGLGGVVLFIATLALVVRCRYGGGDPYPDLRTPPLVPATALTTVVALDYPPGNVAIAADGRMFFNYHPFAKAERFGGSTVFELVDGIPRPFPDASFQARYQGVFGMTVDRQQRLWFIEPAGLDHKATRVLAFDLRTNALVFEYWFPADMAQFAQDLRVSADGGTVYLADTGLFEFTRASLIVLDVSTKTPRPVLAGHPSTQPQSWVIQTKLGAHKLAYGLVTFVVGVDGIELSPDGAWLYYGAMSHEHMYKIPTSALRDSAVTPDQLGSQIVEVGRKPLSDGIAIDRDGNLLITDVEHGGIARLDARGALTTLVSSPDVIWADGVVLAPDGDVVFTDSAIPAYIDQLARPPSQETLTAARPYRIYRFHPPAAP
jgi:sugar lactone lactonase YvrE